MTISISELLKRKKAVFFNTHTEKNRRKDRNDANKSFNINLGSIYVCENDRKNSFKIKVNIQSSVNSGFLNHVYKAKEIIESLICGVDEHLYFDSHKPIHIIELALDDPDTLGQAQWSSRLIRINSTNVNNTDNFKLNDTDEHINVIVMVHEMLHILGVGTGVGWTSLINATTNFYFGKHATREYRNILTSKGFNIAGINKIPIENNFGPGTHRAHFEEGINLLEEPETRIDENNIIYPSFPTEISTGFINLSNHISKMTVGVLQDLGYRVNYDSEYIANI